jgi:predicted MPP superfamily phosphohydrolase
VRLPGIGAPYTHRIDRRIRVASGTQPLGKAQLHISAGLGQLLPIRFACPPELVWLSCEPVA